VCSEKTIKVRSSFCILSLLLPSQMSAASGTTHLQKRHSLPSSARTEHLVAVILRNHGESNPRENAVTKRETRISKLISCYFSQDRLRFHQSMLRENMARRQPSVSPFVNLYLYLAGNWAPPEAWHLVSSEAQSESIAPICAPTCFC